MTGTLRSRLLATGEFGRRRYAVAAAVLLVGTAAAYALELVSASGGVILVPGYPTLLAVVAAAWVGYRRDGLVVAWALAVAPYLGFRADWAFFGLSSRSFAGQFAYFVDPEGLAVNAAFAVVFGTVGFVVGATLRRVAGLDSDGSGP